MYDDSRNGAKAVARFLSDPKVHEHWMDYALQEQPGDRYRAECAIRYLYHYAGLDTPVIVWRDTPYHGAVTAIHLSFGLNLLDLAEGDKPTNFAFLEYNELPKSHVRAYEGVTEPYCRIASLISGLLGIRWGRLFRPNLAWSLPLERQVSIQSFGYYQEIMEAGRDLAVRTAAGLGHGGRLAATNRQTWRAAELGPNSNRLETLVPTPIEWANEVQAHRSRVIEAIEYSLLKRGVINNHCPKDSRIYYELVMGASLGCMFRGPNEFKENLAASWADAPLEYAELTKAWMDVRDSVGTFWVFKEFCVATPLPRIHLDERRRLHCETGPAVQYSGSRARLALYYLHGVSVPTKFVLHPESVTAEEIDSQENAEVRRVLVERYGQERYLRDTGAQIVHQDDFGVLYRRTGSSGEPLVMVKVVNATPEPDGSFKDYFLRVPPDMQTARRAVAWTFGKTEAEYDPNQES